MRQELCHALERDLCDLKSPVLKSFFGYREPENHALINAGNANNAKNEQICRVQRGEQVPVAS